MNKKSARKLLNEFLKKAEDDDDINGSTDEVSKVVKDFHEPSNDVKHGLSDKKASENPVIRKTPTGQSCGGCGAIQFHGDKNWLKKPTGEQACGSNCATKIDTMNLPNKKATKYPSGKTQVCRGASCNKPATGDGLFCNNCYAKSKAGTLEKKPANPKVQYVDKPTQNQIWNDNKKATLLLKQALHPFNPKQPTPEFSPIPGEKSPSPGKAFPAPKAPPSGKAVKPIDSSGPSAWDKYPNASPGAQSSNDYQADYLKNMNKNKPNPLGDFLQGVKNKAKSVSDSFAPGKNESSAGPNHVQKFVDYLKNLHQKNSPKAPVNNQPSLFRPDGSRIVKEPFANPKTNDALSKLYPDNPLKTPEKVPAKPMEAPKALHPHSKNPEAPPEFSPIPGDKSPSSGSHFPAPKPGSSAPLSSTNPATDARKEREKEDTSDFDNELKNQQDRSHEDYSDYDNELAKQQDRSHEDYSDFDNELAKQQERSKPQPHIQRSKKPINTQKSDKEHKKFVNKRPHAPEIQGDTDYKNELDRLKTHASYRKNVTSILKTVLDTLNESK